ncbi:Ig-like domain repeat protein [Methanosphaera sp. ISO3-F5]|uniref:Ig-like domain repeat protein n=1 Tax=Methanosphaera sp. ISO3-F5 TaxID=1452353 RepID=UPI002B25EE51|nr:Ig-like domain repeat protein [Methanosphaera sp. ISO3-F5]WQH64349.1 Ig-like domain repeat protein [Methanosphaera sp. ISO3-F5]
MKKNKIILLITLILLLLSVSYAAETSNTTTSNKDTPTTVQTSTQRVEQSVIKEEANHNKEIMKITQQEKNNKQANSVDANNFKELYSALSDDETDYKDLTINLKSNIKLENDMRISYKYKNVVINGNGKTIDGDNKYMFLDFYTKTVTLRDIKVTECSSYKGVINVYDGKLTLINSSFTNNNDKVISATENSNINIKNCVFTDNKCGSSGGVIFNEYGATIIIDNCRFENNTASSGGAIYFDKGNLSITNSYFNNNYAEFDGGSIYYGFSGDKATIKNTIFTNNNAKSSGGAISAYGSSITIKNCTFNKNTGYEGGAIYNYGSSNNIIQNTFQNNNANENGGAIFNEGGYEHITWPGDYWKYCGSNNLNINKNIFTNNTAINGSAIYNQAKTMKIQNNTFKQNKAKTTGKSIINDTETIIKNNKNMEYSSYSSTIHTSSETATITNNIFDDGITYTKININAPKNKEYKDKITIKGNLTDIDGNKIINSKITIIINGKKYSNKTNANGIYTVSLTANTLGKNNITVTFAGNKQYNTSTAKTTFTVTKRTTKATITKIAQKTYKQNMTITGKLTDSTGTIIKNSNVKVKVNTKTYTVKTNSKGIYSLKVTANKVGTNNVTVTYAGNKYYKAGTKKTTFKTVTRATKLTVNKISTTNKGKTIKITGKLTDNLKSPVMNSLVKIKINKKTVSVKTNKQGVYTYNYKTTKGTNTVTVTFAGSTNYKKTSVKSSFSVK